MGYTIGKREHTSFLDNRGKSVDGYRVWFEMEDGTPDYVEVEVSQFKPEVVRKMIEDKIAAHVALTS